MSRWFRHYAGMMRDPKFTGIAARNGVTLERVTFVWGCILESAAELNNGGAYTFDAHEIAYTLRCDAAEIEKIHAAMTPDLIQDGVIINWCERQFESDQHDGTGAERQRRYRERKRNGTVTAVTPLRNGTVTAHSHSSEDIKTPLPPGSDPKPKRERKRRVTLRGDETMPEFPASDWPGIDLGREWAKCRDHHTSRGTQIADLPATFRMWLRNAGDWNAKRGGVATPISTVKPGQEWRLRLGTLRDNGRWSSGWGPKPGELGCQVPQAILTEFNLGQSEAA